ncbi:MAG: hypothetical protein M0T78_12155 [Actinomycetota bacterium]|nr:hypothetical protein [Actinomycetota bacterium]
MALSSSNAPLLSIPREVKKFHKSLRVQRSNLGKVKITLELDFTLGQKRLQRFNPTRNLSHQLTPKGGSDEQIS